MRNFYGRRWQQPSFLRHISENARDLAKMSVRQEEERFSQQPPEMQRDAMINGREQIARAQAFGYWNLLKDVWPAGTPRVAEEGCGAFLSLYETFPHEELPGDWT